MAAIAHALSRDAFSSTNIQDAPSEPINARTRLSKTVSRIIEYERTIGVSGGDNCEQCSGQLGSTEIA
jgi:hypothetical protein